MMGRRVTLPGRMVVSVGAVPWEAKGLVGTTGAFMRGGTLPVVAEGRDLTFFLMFSVFTVVEDFLPFRAYAET